MPKTEILAPLNKPFERQVLKLVEEGSEILEKYKDLTNRILSFASSFKKISDEALRLDDGDDGLHSKYLRDTLSKSVGSLNTSIWSRWNTIGKYADVLADYAEYLPPQRDSLYEIALAVKERKPIEKWIERERITVESTVRDVRALRQPKSSSTSRKSIGRGRHLNATVTLCFSTYDEAVETLEDLIMKNKQIEVRSHHAFEEAFKSKIGIEGFNKVKDRFR